MKKAILEEVDIPQGVECSYEGKFLTCKKGNVELRREIAIPRIELFVKKDKIAFSSQRANKNENKKIASYIHHLKNMFKGLENKFVYKLESCNVHFPMTLKIEGDKLAINNFLGEKIPRYAKILPGVDVQIKGNLLTVSSHDKESAGQTAANLEKATKVSKRDRRIFQDGIYITEKPGENQ